MVQSLPNEVLHKIIHAYIPQFTIKIAKIKTEVTRDHFEVTGFPVVLNVMLVSKGFFEETQRLLSEKYDGKVETEGLAPGTWIHLQNTHQRFVRWLEPRVVELRMEGFIDRIADLKSKFTSLKSLYLNGRYRRKYSESSRDLLQDTELIDLLQNTWQERFKQLRTDMSTSNLSDVEMTYRYFFFTFDDAMVCLEIRSIASGGAILRSAFEVTREDSRLFTGWAQELREEI